MDDSNLFDPVDEMGSAPKTTIPPDPYAEQLMPDRAGPIQTIEALLKRPGMVLYALRRGDTGRVVWALLLVALVCFAAYGLVAGSLSGGNQLWAAPFKIVVGSLLSVVICLPSLYVFLCLSGVDARWRETLGALVAMVTLSALLLIGLAPVVWVFSQSTESVALMACMHLTFWAVATTLGARLLVRFLSRDGGRARLGGWLAIYLLVCLQMMTTLRPVLGRADEFLPSEKRFFLQHFGEMLAGRSAAENAARESETSPSRR